MSITRPHVGLSLAPPLPTAVTIDSSSACNLRCPMCPTGAHTSDMSTGLLTPGQLRKYLDEFPDLRTLSLYHIGEPFLNPRIFELLAIAMQRGVRIHIDSHFSLPMEDAFLRRLLRSGLSRLRASIDGASAEGYSAYRINGDFELAFGNLRRLRNLQKNEGPAGLRLLWKFIVNRWNVAEIPKAQALAADIDVPLVLDQFSIVDDCPDRDLTRGVSHAELRSKWLPMAHPEHLLPRYQPEWNKPYFEEGPCPWLFNSVVVHSDGSVMPCCYTASAKSAMGNLSAQSIEEIWNSAAYRYARSLFLDDVRVPRVPVACETCPIYARAR
jgi:radical SAM protein with 4Fe4S-binding SPASM domain